jgi:hypothetical protein
MNKTDLVNFINKEILQLDLVAQQIDWHTRQHLMDTDYSKYDKAHFEFELASMNQHYVEYVHDLERIIKTLNGEPFASTKI